MLSRLVITFLPRNKCLLISWLQSPCAVILELKKIESVIVSLFPHLFAMMWWDQISWSSSFECWVLSQFFDSSLSLSSRGPLVPLHFLPLELCHLHIWGYWYLPWQSWFQLGLHPAWHFAWCSSHISEINRVTVYSLVPLFSFLNAKVSITFKMYTPHFPHSDVWKEAIFPSLTSSGHPPPLIQSPPQSLFNFPIISVFAIVFSQCVFLWDLSQTLFLGAPK